MANTVFLNLVNRVDSLIETVETSNNAAIQEVRDRTDGLVYYSRAWAESDTNPDPTNPDSKSAKSWADVAQQIAIEMEVDLAQAVEICESAADAASDAINITEAAASTANTRAIAATEAAASALTSATTAAQIEVSVTASALTADNRAGVATAAASAAATSMGTATSAASAALSSASAAALSAGSANDAKIASQNLMDQFANFRFLGKVEWWQGNPAMIPAGFLPLNGQVLNRADYPDLWSDVDNGVFASTTDAIWLASPNERGRFTRGNGTTTFRMPDLNGSQSGSMNGAFLRGAKNPEGWSAGAILGDAIRNFTGGFKTLGFNSEDWGGTGVFNRTAHTVNGPTTNDNVLYREWNILIDASRQVPTAAENRPVSAVGTWIMLVNGAPARQFNPETGAGLGTNNFGGKQTFSAGFEWVGVVPQLIQTDVDQGLTTAQKLRAITNAGGVSYASAQTLTALEKRRALENIAALSYGEDQSGAITAAQKLISRKNIGMGTPAEIAVITQALSVGDWGAGGHHYDFRSMQGSGTQIWRFLQATHVKQPSSTDSTTVAYSWTFMGNAPQPIVSNGDATVEGSLLLSVFGVTTSAFGVASRLNGAQYLGVYRVNYAAMGRIA